MANFPLSILLLIGVCLDVAAQRNIEAPIPFLPIDSNHEVNSLRRNCEGKFSASLNLFGLKSIAEDSSYSESYYFDKLMKKEWLDLTYFRNGMLKSIYLKNVQTQYAVHLILYPDGNIETVQYSYEEDRLGVDTCRHLLAERVYEYYPNGQLRQRLLFDSLNYELINYYDNGSIFSRGYINKGLQYTRQYTEYYENGRLHWIGMYKAHYAMNEAISIKDGLWIEYDRDGYVIETKYFRNGIVVSFP